MKGLIRKPKGLTIWVTRSGGYAYSSKGRGRTGAKVRSWFTNLPVYERRAVLHGWVNDQVARVMR